MSIGPTVFDVIHASAPKKQKKPIVYGLICIMGAPLIRCALCKRFTPNQECTHKFSNELMGKWDTTILLNVTHLMFLTLI